SRPRRRAAAPAAASRPPLEPLAPSLLLEPPVVPPQVAEGEAVARAIGLDVEHSVRPLPVGAAGPPPGPGEVRVDGLLRVVAAPAHLVVPARHRPRHRRSARGTRSRRRQRRACHGKPTPPAHASPPCIPREPAL